MHCADRHYVDVSINGSAVEVDLVALSVSLALNSTYAAWTSASPIRPISRGTRSI